MYQRFDEKSLIILFFIYPNKSSIEIKKNLFQKWSGQDRGKDLVILNRTK